MPQSINNNYSKCTIYTFNFCSSPEDSAVVQSAENIINQVVGNGNSAGICQMERPSIFQKRVMIVNFKSPDPKNNEWLIQNQQLFGFTFDEVFSEPDTLHSFVSMNKWSTSFIVHSLDELKNLENYRRAEEAKGHLWFHRFSVDGLLSLPPFLWPYHLDKDQMFAALLTATKNYLDEKTGCRVNGMGLRESISTSSVIRRALHCQRTIEHLSSHLNKRGKAFLARKRRELEKNNKK